MYFREAENGNHVYLLLYVDDMLLVSKCMVDVSKLKERLKSEFDMKDLGSAKKILGMESLRDRASHRLILSQESYMRKVLLRFNMAGAKPVSTPIAPHFKLSSAQSPQTKEDKEKMKKIPYASAIGSMMYAMVCTRPDISYAVSLVSRFMANAGSEHWNAVKWVLRYLAHTVSMGLHYERNMNEKQAVVGYVDSDYAGELDKRRSLTGYVFTLFGNTISRKASLQHVVSLSTTEAEFIAITEAVKEAIWVKGLVSELGIS